MLDRGESPAAQRDRSSARLRPLVPMSMGTGRDDPVALCPLVVLPPQVSLSSLRAQAGQLRSRQSSRFRCETNHERIRCATSPDVIGTPEPVVLAEAQRRLFGTRLFRASRVSKPDSTRALKTLLFGIPKNSATADWDQPRRYT